jgi:heme/copper-type cytochrome/quinol oxidase subunit 4
MIEQLEYTSFIINKLVFPFLMIVMTIFAVWIGYRKQLFSENKPLRDQEPRVPVIHGDGNVIHIGPAELQQRLAYDATRFDEYHQQSINQSRISFWFSLFFASIGFLIIATSIFTLSDKTGYVGIVAGTIIDVVSALFFYQSNKARQLMSEFFDKLRSDRKLEESLKLCEGIDNDLMRNSLKVTLSLDFAGLSGSDKMATEIIRLHAPESKTGVNVYRSTEKPQEASGSSPGNDETAA